MLPHARTWPALDIGFRAEAGETVPVEERLAAALDELQPWAIEESEGAWRVFFPSAVARARAADALRAFPGLVLTPRDVPDEDWAGRSQADLGPVRIGRITVRPPWAPGADGVRGDVAEPPGDLDVVILPSMGFGSGHHATTRACLALLQQAEVKGRTVLDVGTGSGILAIAAARLDASLVIAIEADPDALDNARENLALNHLAEGPGGVDLRLADFRTLAARPADVVLANLTASTLVDQAGWLIASVAPGGCLVASGFGPGDEATVTAALGGDAAVERRLEDDDWVGLLLRPSPAGQEDRVRDWIDTLGLSPHPEGGFFRETYRAGESIPAASLPPRFTGSRPFATAIYFLLARGQFSALHRLRADEIWHFYAGGPLTLHVIEPTGAHVAVTLGPDRAAGQVFQAVVRAGTWFGAALAPGAASALVGCTVAPGFGFADFELGDRATLVAQFPAHRALIERLTHEHGAMSNEQ